ncbi:hypothetical protein [Pannonibacter tanglangensis]|uniref:Uncharacterized protein n=1 Tax=Pannonibacter tanglangensis TaxID=2750084 RepID=A0ABW9ZB69_9HYPH|nr:hypothetical protein [Pannonibacter sp. XCT-34]NBN62080.1 hypothetical protein [Pannonibacter sp. XCT-34]
MNETLSPQASRVIAAFGGAAQLARFLTASGYPIRRETIYRWTYPPEQDGRGGLIPRRWIPIIKAIAPKFGVVLTPRHFEE